MRILIFILLIFSYLSIEAQVVSESAAKAELAKRGISEERFREELQKRGINLDKIDPNNPQELLNNEAKVKEVLEFLEKEAKQKTSQTEVNNSNLVKKKEEEIKKKQIESENAIQAAKSSKEIQKAVNKGASLDEAVSENLQDKLKDKLPEPITYGQQLFRDNSLKIFRTAEDSKPTKNYVLGPGDVVAVSIFNTSVVNFAKEINKEGYIEPNNLPRFYLTGLTIEQAEELLYQKLRNRSQFSRDEFTVTITTARTINVNIFGEVFNNGSFNISAVNTAFNALVAAGGPNDIGSVRKIKLQRPGLTKTIDVYEFLSNPSVTKDLYLQENDYIVVPVAEKLVTIYGAVNRPFRYELLENEDLNAIIKYAGGLLPNALKRIVQITRMENDKEVIVDVDLNDLNSKNSDFKLKNGDIIKINALSTNAQNTVTIVGAVEEQGVYSLESGMKINDLLKKANLKENAVKETAYLRRLNEDLITVRYELVNVAEAMKNPASASNILLKKGDVLTLRALADFTEIKEVKIDGAIRNPGKYQLSDNSLKISDVLFLSGGVDDGAAAFGYLFRDRQGNDKTKEYIYLDVKSIAANIKSSSNILVAPNDSIYIYHANDYIDKAFVKINGAVRRPAEFLYNPSLSVKDVILMAGGLKQEASPNRIDIFRIKFDENKKTTTLAARLNINEDSDLSKAAEFMLQPHDLVFVRYAPEYELQRTIDVSGEVAFPGPYALVKDNTKLSDIIEMAGGPTQEAYLEGATLYRNKDYLGYVVINLREALKNKSSYQNIILQEEDLLFIPKQNDIVSIIGATNYDDLYPDKLSDNGKINIAFQGGKSAIHYIDNFAGGVDEKGDRKRITVEHRNGKVEKVKNYLFFKKYPSVKEGSVIKVPYKRQKTEAEKKEEKDINWGDALKDSIAQATAILSLILLIRSVD